MNPYFVNELRKRSWHSLGPHAACAGGMSVEQLKQFCAFAFMPTDAQLVGLANYFGMKVEAAA